MKILNTNSLAVTIDNINEILFYGKKFSSADKAKAVKWIVSRLGLPKSYWGMFAPTDYDYKNGITLFTGEKVTTGAGTSHFLGEESCRALRKIGSNNKTAMEAAEKAMQGLNSAIKCARGRGIDTPDGYYCCAKCSVSYWRNLSSYTAPENEKLLNNGMKILKASQHSNGKWRRFPFFYTLYALTGIDSKSAIEEMRFAAPVLEKYIRRKPENKYGKRKVDLAEKVLEMI